MADKKIGDLVSADVVKDEDLLIMEQAGIAKNVTGALLLAYLEPLLQEKTTEILKNLNAVKTVNGIEPDEDGNVTLPKTTAVDFTGYSDGSFEETLSNRTTVTHTVAYDADGVPISVDDIAVTGISVNVTGV